MELIVAVYEHWGIGCNGTQPLVLNADRKFFREMTRNATVVVGRKTAMDFPGQKPLPGRRNLLLSRQDTPLPGFELCNSPAQVAKKTAAGERVVVIGGGSVYRQMLPLCDRAIVTKIGAAPPCDTFFPDLDADENWEMAELLCTGREDGTDYQMCLYRRK